MQTIQEAFDELSLNIPDFNSSENVQRRLRLHMLGLISGSKYIPKETAEIRESMLNDFEQAGDLESRDMFCGITFSFKFKEPIDELTYGLGYQKQLLHRW